MKLIDLRSDTVTKPDKNIIEEALLAELGDDEYGSTIALPIWLDFMSDVLVDLDIKESKIPEGLSFARVNKKTGKIDDSVNADIYFELFLNENIKD